MPFVAAGTYGCVYEPAIPCKKGSAKDSASRSRQKDAVSKVFGEHNDFYKEKNLQKVVISIDPKNKFTRPYYGDCEVDMTNQLDALKCKHVDLNTTTMYKQIIYKNGGNDLKNLLRTEGGDYIKLRKVLKGFLPIVKGLHLLSKHGYSHLDLKPDNILCNLTQSENKSAVLYLIDFGLMTELDNIFNKRKSFILEHDYVVYPPEFKMYISKAYKSGYDFIESFMDNFSVQYKVSDFGRVDAYKVMTEWINYSRQEQEDDLKDLSKVSDFKKYANKIDIYSLGIILLLLFVWSRSNSIKFAELIKSMIRFSPKKRIGNAALVKDFKTVLKSI